MELFLKNIGKIGEASLVIDGITVIAGENNTGKSTVGRALFAVFNSFCDSEIQVRQARIKSIAGLIERRRIGWDLEYSVAGRALAPKFVYQMDKYKSNPDLIRNELVRTFSEEEIEKISSPEKYFDDLVRFIIERLNIPGEKIFQVVLENRLESEFDNQINNIFLPGGGQIRLRTDVGELSVDIVDHKVAAISDPDNIRFYNEAVYIDDPLVLDELNLYQGRFSGNHRSHLLENLRKSDEEEINPADKAIAAQKLEKINRIISSVCEGAIVLDQPLHYGYRKAGSDKVLSIRNLSMGLKTFVILKRLLACGRIGEKSMVILDEPEIHLHPKWQLLFAELIILLHREFHMDILLNTHSPYFLNAIEVYAARYDVAEQCRYYMASISQDVAAFENVTDHIELIYSKLASPLQELENERYRNA